MLKRTLAKKVAAFFLCAVLAAGAFPAVAHEMGELLLLEEEEELLLERGSTGLIEPMSAPVAWGMTYFSQWLIDGLNNNAFWDLFRTGYAQPVFSYDAGALVATGRTEDWHGLDIMLSEFFLAPGQTYRITVQGETDGVLSLNFPAAGPEWGWAWTYGTSTSVSLTFSTDVPAGIVLDDVGFRIRVRASGDHDFTVTSVIIESVDDIWRRFSLYAVVNGMVPGVSQETANMIWELAANHGDFRVDYGWFNWDNEWENSGVRAALYADIGLDIPAWDWGWAVTWSSSDDFRFAQRYYDGSPAGRFVTHFRNPDAQPPPYLPFTLTPEMDVPDVEPGGTYTFWDPPAAVLAPAGKMVVEYSGTIDGWFAFARAGGAVPEGWSQFDLNDGRVSRAPDRITFDMRGLPGASRIGFMIAGVDDIRDVVTRVYLDSLPTIIPTGPAWEMMERLGIGINIGNTLDANPTMGGGSMPANPLDTEISWGEARIEPWHFDAIELKGFDHVRIPITWENHILPDGTIRPEWMDRVQEVVDMALERDLLVVINTHHERTPPNSFYHMIDRNEMAGAEEWLVNVWTQILARFGGYCTERLLFEPMNEPFRAYHGGWVNLPGGGIDLGLFERVMHLNNVALDLIRSHPGNEERFVLTTVPGAQSDFLPHYIPLHPDDDFVILSIFYYPPHNFSHIVAAHNAGIPLYIKETSPILDLAHINDVPVDEAVAWIARYFGRFADMGIPIAYWTHEESPHDRGWQIFSRHMNIWNAPLVAAVFNAYGRNPGPDYGDVIPPNLPLDITGDGTTDETGDFTFWFNIPIRELVAAERMVIEYNTPITDGFAFSFFPHGGWEMFEYPDPRITREPGKIIFDMRGLQGDALGFAIWGLGHPAQLAYIDRIFLDTWGCHCVGPCIPGDIDGNGRVTTADATLLARHIVNPANITICRTAADVFGDGDIDSANLVLLARRLVGHRVTLDGTMQR